MNRAREAVGAVWRIADVADTGLAVRAATRKVTTNGVIRFASTRYHAGRWLAGQTVEVVCDQGLVHCTIAAC